MTFEQFQATRTWCDDLGRALRDEMLDGIGGYLYDGSFYIDEMHSGPHRWHLIIERSEWLSDDLEELERRLWDDFAKGEINPKRIRMCLSC